MASRSLLSVLFIVCFSFSTVFAQDYFLYLRWPGGVCSNEECCFPLTWSPVDDFLLNYLALQASTPRPVCNRTAFEPNAVEPLIGDMFQYWPSLTCPSDSGWRDWESLWDDNGICTGLKQAEYFGKALALRKSANLLGVLASKGIVPSSETSYKLADVEAAITEAVGTNSTLYCVPNATKSPIIRGIRACVDKTGSSFVPCPVKRGPYCTDPVNLLPLSSSINAVEDASLSLHPIDVVVSA